MDTTVCEGKAIYILGQYIMESGTVGAEYRGSNRCDSLITYRVYIQEPEVQGSDVDNILTVLQSAASYQWINDTGEKYCRSEQSIKYSLRKRKLFCKYNPLLWKKVFT